MDARWSNKYPCSGTGTRNSCANCYERAQHKAVENTARRCLGSSLRSLYFAHISMVNAGHLAIVPGNRNSVPTRFSDLAAVGSIALPPNAGALLERSRFGGSHFPPPIVWIERKPELSFRPQS